jgi:hypothetical protein
MNAKTQVRNKERNKLHNTLQARCWQKQWLLACVACCGRFLLLPPAVLAAAAAAAAAAAVAVAAAAAALAAVVAAATSTAAAHLLSGEFAIVDSAMPPGMSASASTPGFTLLNDNCKKQQRSTYLRQGSASMIQGFIMVHYGRSANRHECCTLCHHNTAVVDDRYVCTARSL